MECLAAGRGISLPSSSTRAWPSSRCAPTGGYARVRSQFKTPIGKFEGVEEALTRMGGNLYMMDATRMLTAAAVDLGEKPAVLSAIAKYHLTERARAGRQRRAWTSSAARASAWGRRTSSAPRTCSCRSSITVEGANILTRSLIIFGQGAIRCHPYVLQEIAATRDDADRAQASIAFDAALFGHICASSLSNMARTFVMGLTGSHFVARARRRRARDAPLLPAADALLGGARVPRRRVDGPLGGALKRKEKLSARLGDILSLLYLCSATLKRYEDEGRQAADAPLMHWAIWDAMFKAQNAFEGVISNFPEPRDRGR